MHKEHSHKSKDQKGKNDLITFESQFFFNIKLELVSQTIKIEMQKKQTQQFYDCNITQENFDLNPQLSALYSDAYTLFQDLRTNYNQLLISEDGVISMELSLQILGKTAKKQIKFYAKRSSDFMNQLNAMAAEHFRQMEILKADHAREINDLRNEIQAIKSKLIAFETTSKNQVSLPPENYGMNFTKLGIYEEDNKNKRNFTVKKFQKSIRIIRIIYDGTFRNFVLNVSVPKGRVNVVVLNQVKTKSGSARYGLVTKNLVSSNDSFFNKQAIFMNASKGNHTVASKQYHNGKTIKDGSIVKMTIDTFNWTISWTVEASFKLDCYTVETYIPEELKAVDLFVAVALMDENDEIDLSIAQ